MTDADKPVFLDAIVRLSVALREPAPDVVQLTVYFRALADVEIEFLLEAADQLMASASWFPKASEWRAAAALVARKRLDEQRATLRRLPRPRCAACDDTGWRRLENGRVARCPCAEHRYLERLGRVPSSLVTGTGEVFDVEAAPSPHEARRVLEAVNVPATAIKTMPRVAVVADSMPAED